MGAMGPPRHCLMGRPRLPDTCSPRLARAPLGPLVGQMIRAGIVGVSELFEVQVDGIEAARLGLKGKPHRDAFLEAARRLGVAPERAAVVEDAIAGVAAGRAGGADLVVGDLAEIAAASAPAGRAQASAVPLPNALDRVPGIRARLAGRRAAVFLGYDGTLTPIVPRPDLAVLSDAMRAAVARLAARCMVAVVSGRDRADIERLVGLDSPVYAGSHGFDIAGPGGLRKEHEGAAAFLPTLDRAERRLRRETTGIEDALVERKRFAIAIHYRLVAQAEVARLERAVAAASPDLRRTAGKKVFELRPRIDWDKGKAVLWLLGALGLDGEDVMPVYVGDDETDEDAFAALAGRGIGILVAETPQTTAAAYRLADPDEVGRFLDELAATLGGRAS